MIAAPAFAAEAGKTTTTAPVIKADQSQTKVSNTAVKPSVKADARGNGANAKARTGGKADAKAGAKADAKGRTGGKGRRGGRTQA